MFYISVSSSHTGSLPRGSLRALRRCGSAEGDTCARGGRIPSALAALINFLFFRLARVASGSGRNDAYIIATWPRGQLPRHSLPARTSSTASGTGACHLARGPLRYQGRPPPRVPPLHLLVCVAFTAGIIEGKIMR